MTRFMMEHRLENRETNAQRAVLKNAKKDLWKTWKQLSDKEKERLFDLPEAEREVLQILLSDQQDLSCAEQKLKAKTERVNGLKQKTLDLKKEKNSLKKKADRQKKSYKKVVASKSYKIGRLITAPVRRLKRIAKGSR